MELENREGTIIIIKFTMTFLQFFTASPILIMLKILTKTLVKLSRIL